MQLQLHIEHDHPSYQGHFPGRPILPGVLLLDHAKHMIESYYAIKLSGLSVAKFHSFVSPGEPLTLDFETVASGVRYEIRSKERKVADGRFTVVIEGSKS